MKDKMAAFDASYAALRDAVLEMPTGDPDDLAVRNTVNHIQSFLASHDRLNVRAL
jgi:hypothetical protein